LTKQGKTISDLLTRIRLIEAQVRTCKNYDQMMDNLWKQYGSFQDQVIKANAGIDTLQTRVTESARVTERTSFALTELQGDTSELTTAVHDTQAKHRASKKALEQATSIIQSQANKIGTLKDRMEITEHNAVMLAEDVIRNRDSISRMTNTISGSGPENVSLTHKMCIVLARTQVAQHAYILSTHFDLSTGLRIPEQQVGVDRGLLREMEAEVERLEAELEQWIDRVAAAQDARTSRSS